MAMTGFGKLSVVIPVGPDDNTWQHLLKELTVFGTELEIILSACQSQPIDIELPNHVLWFQSRKGRAHQLNVGAKHATRSFIWFLHADTCFTEDVKQAVFSFIKMNYQTLGYFRLKFACDGPAETRLNAWGANIRSRYFGLPFGDQGFIMEHPLFEHTNGFNESVLVGEDLDFVVRVKASGMQLQELPAQLITSSRRYKEYGWFYTTIRHLWLTWCLTRQAKRRLVFS